MTREEYLEGCSLAELADMHRNGQLSLDEYIKIIREKDGEETIS